MGSVSIEQRAMIIAGKVLKQQFSAAAYMVSRAPSSSARILLMLRIEHRLKQHPDLVRTLQRAVARLEPEL